MNKIIHDLIKCIKYSLICAVILIIAGIIIGAIKSVISWSFSFTYIAEWGWKMGIYGSCFGLSISALSFVSKNTLRPLNYKEEWEEYFKKFNLPHVIFFISLFCLLYMIIIDWLIFTK